MTMKAPHPIKTIGFIGLGNAGYPLALTLAKAGYTLLVRDADEARAERFAIEHPNSRVAPNSPDAFKHVNALITMLPNGNTVRDVLLGPQGVAQHLKPGTIIIDTSSSSPYHTIETGKLLSHINPSLTLLDAPITQSYAFSLSHGDATLMVGCSSPSVFQLAKPVLDTMGKYVFHMGPLGSGHAMKTFNNYVSAGGLLALCDALMAGQKWGLDPGKMVEVMNVGTGGNFSTRESFRTEALTRRFQSGYQLSLFLKDMKIAQEVIRNLGIESPLARVVVDELWMADRVAGPGADHTQIIHSWEKKAGQKLKQSGPGSRQSEL